eukprot:m.101627 g.101627  ORF g.101627 m.101627 type:complete len:138 (-) comp27338_c0_seq2:132-545(-)
MISPVRCSNWGTTPEAIPSHTFCVNPTPQLIKHSRFCFFLKTSLRVPSRALPTLPPNVGIKPACGLVTAPNLSAVHCGPEKPASHTHDPLEDLVPDIEQSACCCCCGCKEEPPQRGIENCRSNIEIDIDNHIVMIDQ